MCGYRRAPRRASPVQVVANERIHLKQGGRQRPTPQVSPERYIRAMAFQCAHTAHISHAQHAQHTHTSHTHVHSHHTQHTHTHSARHHTHITHTHHNMSRTHVIHMSHTRHTCHTHSFRRLNGLLHYKERRRNCT